LLVDLRGSERGSHAHALFSVVVGAVLGASISRGILEERLSGGSPSVALLVNALMTALAVALLFVMRRARPAASAFGLHAVGALAGIACVHLALRAGWIDGAPWLLERPAQLMNDLVAALATLGIVWACARGLDWRLLFGVLVALSLYRATAACWHLDRAPFAMTVQELSFMQLLAMALALPIYRHLGLRPREGGER